MTEHDEAAAAAPDGVVDLDPQGVTLAIDGTWNDRDAAALGGVAPGVLLRSAALAGLTDAGRDRLTALGVTDVVDLRSDDEAARQGADAVPAGVTVHRLPIAPGAPSRGSCPARRPTPRRWTASPGS
ncbi:tyrosine-protein phosphatase [Serinibacter arcticus]|uniref:tyrosine-protein phosphatase n=1 Tax=Serinibacter arcticus TaxID=1655435 RepID=UPI001304863A|nr:tyrosine-protein phosphatase [Serinibacter arcticus]